MRSPDWLAVQASGGPNGLRDWPGKMQSDECDWSKFAVHYEEIWLHRLGNKVSGWGGKLRGRKGKRRRHLTRKKRIFSTKKEDETS